MNYAGRQPFRFPPVGAPLPSELSFYVNRGHLDPEWPAYGAVPDFDATTQTGTDNTAAFQACIDDALAQKRPIHFGNTVPGDQFLINGTLRASSLTMIGNGSVNGGTWLTFGNTTGSCLQLTHAANRIEGILIDSTNARLASGGPTTKHGLLVSDDDDVSQAAHSNTFINDVSVRRQPGAGLYLIGILVNSYVRGGVMAGNYGPGILADDGTFHGRTNLVGGNGLGIVELENNRLYDNGGEGIRIGSVGQAHNPFRFEVRRAEAFGNGWNAAARDFDAQIAINEAQNCRLSTNAWGDINYASTTTLFGDPRTAKGARGLAVKLNAAARCIIENERYMDVGQSVNGVSCFGIRVSGGAMSGGVDQAIAFEFDANCLDVFLDIPTTTGATQLVKALGLNNNWRYSGEHYVGVGVALSGQRQNNAFLARSITSGSLHISEQNVRVQGEGDVADTLTNLTVLGITPPNGLSGRLLSTSAYAITIEHGAGNIRTRTGANITLSANTAYSWCSDGTHVYVG